MTALNLLKAALSSLISKMLAEFDQGKGNPTIESATVPTHTDAGGPYQTSMTYKFRPLYPLCVPQNKTATSQQSLARDSSVACLQADSAMPVGVLLGTD